MSAALIKVEGRLKVIRCSFYAAFCEDLIAFENTTGGEDTAAQPDVPVWDPLDGDCPIPVNHRDRMRCDVCKLK